MIRTFTAVVCLGLLTAACGTSETDRALSAGGMGVLGGALIAGPVGAVVGGAAGAAAGAATEPNQINLGPPIWKAFGD